MKDNETMHETKETLQKERRLMDFHSSQTKPDAVLKLQEKTEFFYLETQITQNTTHLR